MPRKPFIASLFLLLAVGPIRHQGPGVFPIKVTFLDTDAGSFRLIFRTGEGLFQKAHPLTGDGKLKSSTFLIRDLYPNGLVNGFDFLLEAGAETPDITVAMVRAIRLGEE